MYIIKRKGMVEGDWYLQTYWNGIAPIFTENKNEIKEFDQNTAEYYALLIKRDGFDVELIETKKEN